MVCVRNAELYHHGILGQRWGKRNGPPYPLGLSDHSASEKKAGWKKSLKKSNMVDSSKKKFNLTDKQKKAIMIGIGAALVVGGAVYLSKSGALDGLVSVGKPVAEKLAGEFSGVSVDSLSFDPKDFVSDEFLSPVADIKQLPKIEDFPKKLTSEYLIDDLKNVNPLKSKSNCVACAITEYFRSRGYDVAARSRDGNQFSEEFLINEVELLFPGFKDQFHRVPINLNLMNSADKVRRDILKCGEGSSGIFAVNYSDEHIEFMKKLNPDFNDKGHAIAWKVMNEKVIFLDGQTELSGDGWFEHLIGTADTNKVFVGQLDNLKIDPSFIPVFMMPA